MIGEPRTRRAVLGSIHCGLAIGATALAGCPQPGETVLDGSSGDSGTTGGNQATPIRDDPPVLTAEPEYDGWFADVENYDDGTVVYPDDTRDVDIEVGVPGNGANRAFRFPAIAIPDGTTVTWSWTGNGGAHNVVAAEGSFDSGEPTDSATATFEHRFPNTGLFKYYCEPHRQAGMKGAVAVYPHDE